MGAVDDLFSGGEDVFEFVSEQPTVVSGPGSPALGNKIFGVIRFGNYDDARKILKQA
jgi:hypothetical protein